LALWKNLPVWFAKAGSSTSGTMAVAAFSGALERPDRPAQRSERTVHEVRMDETWMDRVGRDAGAVEPARELEGEQKVRRLGGAECRQRAERVLVLQILEIELRPGRRGEDEDPCRLGGLSSGTRRLSAGTGRGRWSRTSSRTRRRSRIASRCRRRRS
jgi:hypothetical protein